MQDYPTTASINMLHKGATTSDVARVSSEMGKIQKLLAESSEVGNLMEQRLHAVLRPSPPSAANGNTSDARSASSPLTSDLEDFSGQLSRLLEHYNDLLTRLEV